MTATPIRRALLSVSDKTGLAEFARALAGHGVALVSTGGTRKALTAAGLPSTEVSELTGFPEMMDGRVKTLHPAVHGGLLALRDHPDHVAAMRQHGIQPIDLLVCGLYPFEQTVASGAPDADIIENIDIGGVALIRAAAKNFAYVTVIVDPADYGRVLEALPSGGVPAALRRELAGKAFARTAAYDAAISGWFGRDATTLPPWIAFGGARAGELRYGENPHQPGAFYRTGDARPGVGSARVTQGKALSYNNIADADAAYELVAEFDPARTAAVAIIKHANPCGVAEAATLRDAYLRALATDPTSAFGGIVALNRTLDATTATEIVRLFTEIVIAPAADDAALAILAKKKDLRVLLAGALPDPRGRALTVKTVAGGLLVQQRDATVIDDLDVKVVTRKAPTPRELADLRFAARVAKHVKSNAIVYARDGATVGVGAGQMSRVDSARIAVEKADDAARAAGRPVPATAGTVVASDAFFPFADGLEVLARAGATAVIQPGGSMRDAEVIAAADAAGLAMVFTGVRNFRH